MDERTEQLLRELAAQLNTTVEFLWEALVRQAYVDGVIELIGFVVCLIIVAILIKAGNWFKSLAKAESQSDAYDADPVPFYFGMIMMYLLALFATSIGITEFLRDALTAYINPHYYAIERVLELLKAQ